MQEKPNGLKLVDIGTGKDHSGVIFAVPTPNRLLKLGEVVRTSREEQGLSQAELAGGAGVPLSAVQGLESAPPRCPATPYLLPRGKGGGGGQAIGALVLLLLGGSGCATVPGKTARRVTRHMDPIIQGTRPADIEVDLDQEVKEDAVALAAIRRRAAESLGCPEEMVVVSGVVEYTATWHAPLGDGQPPQQGTHITGSAACMRSGPAHGTAGRRRGHPG